MNFIPGEEGVPLNVPPLRQWQLNSSSTYYDHMVAAPSDEALFFMWLFWAILTAFVTVITMIVFLGILSNQRARKTSFNIYLIFLMIPDLIFSFFCLINCALNLRAGHYVSPAWCQFQSVYAIFGIGANAWLNGLIIRELYIMVRSSHSRRRYFPPSRTTVVKQAAAVYLWSAFVASLGLFHLPVQKTGLHSGAACLPLIFDTPSTIFFFVVFLPIFAFFPLLYAVWVTFNVFYYKLLPRTGKTRNLTVYFLRLVGVYIVMWLPSLLFIFVFGGWVSPWVSTTCSHA